MLLPFEYVILTKSEAKIIINFIEKQTATKRYPINRDKIEDLGILGIYDNLSIFLDDSNHYENQLKYFSGE